MRVGPAETAVRKPTTAVPVETVVHTPVAAAPAPTPRPEPEPGSIARAAPEPLPRAEAPARARKRWPLYVGAALLAVALVVAAVLLIPNLLDGRPGPAAVSTQSPASTLVVTPEPEATPVVQVEATSASIPPPALQAPEGWTNYGNANFVTALARHEDTLWVGSESGLLRWSLGSGSHTRFAREDGLPSAFINDLMVDEAGVLWVATDGGVGRYDGESWTTYDVADGLDANWITALFQDQFGGLWAGSRGGERGLNFYEDARWGVPPPDFLPPLPVEYPNVTVMGGNEDVGYFVGLEDEGLLLFEGEGWLWLTEVDGLPAGGVLAALLTGDSLWVSYEEAVLRIDLETGDWETLPLEYILAIHETASGEIWFGGAWRAIRYDPYTGDSEEVETGMDPIPGWLVTDITEDADRLWLGTYGGGVAGYDDAGWEVWATEGELAGNLVEAIRQDHAGNIWVTHDGAGLSRYQPAVDAWQAFDESGGALDWPSDPGIDSQGNLWIGDYGEPVYYDGQTWNTFTAPELADVSIYAIEIGPGDVLWLATDGALLRYDPASGQWTSFTGADHPILADLWAFLVTSDGTFWAGGAEGVIQYDGQTWTTPQASGSPPEWVDDLAEAPDGSLWLAADGELVHLAEGQWTYVEWPSDGWLESLAVAPDGTIWAGYDGLGHYDPITGEWELFTTADGLGHMLVQDILVTPEGVVWVGTMAGISRYVPSR